MLKLHKAWSSREYMGIAPETV